MIEISESAQAYLRDLLSKQERASAGVFVANPGTPGRNLHRLLPAGGGTGRCSCSIRLHRLVRETQRALPRRRQGRLPGRSPRRSADHQGPNARVPKVDDDSPLEDRINYVLYNEVNPMLAAHGSMVTLVEVEESIAVLQFGGGCQGCAAVDMTVSQGVEALVEQIPS